MSVTRVVALPPCTFCHDPAYVGCTVPHHGWPYVCSACFRSFRCTLDGFVLKGRAS